MVEDRDIITVDIHDDQIRYILERAKAASLGGRSNVYAGKERRRSSLQQDQFVSQAAQYALSIYLTGSIHAWRNRRLALEKNPRKGNDGQQLSGSNVQVRSSKLRPGGDPLSYRLAVREPERRKDAVYVLGVVEYDFDEDNDSVPSGVKVHLVGWAHDDMLPVIPQTGGKFEGAYLLGGYDLHPLPRLTWGLPKDEAPVDDLVNDLANLGIGPLKAKPRVETLDNWLAKQAVGSVYERAAAREIPGVKSNSDPVQPNVSVANGNEPQEIVIRIKVER